MTNTPLVDRLRPYEKIIMRLQEVLLLKRPVPFAFLILFVLGTASTIKSWNSGVFASVSFILIALYTTAVLYTYLGDKLEPYLFPELTPEKINQGVKLHSLEELCEILSAHCCCKCNKESNSSPRSAVSSIIASAVCFFLAFVFYFVNGYYFTLAVILLILITPFVFSQPAVLQLIHKGKLPKYAQPGQSAPAPAPAPAAASIVERAVEAAAEAVEAAAAAAAPSPETIAEKVVEAAAEAVEEAAAPNE